MKPTKPYIPAGNLVWAIRKNDLKTVKNILEGLKFTGSGDSINQLDQNGELPINVALRHKWRDMLPLFFASPDLNLECRDKFGVTPLQEAAQLGEVDAIELLVKRGFDIKSSANGDGLSPLHIAIGYNNLDAARTLINCGAPVNGLCNKYPTDDDDKIYTSVTPLHCAAITGNEEGISLLASYGADPDIPTGEGCSARELLIQRFPDKVFVIDGEALTLDEWFLKIFGEKKGTSELSQATIVEVVPFMEESKTATSSSTPLWRQSTDQSSDSFNFSWITSGPSSANREVRKVTDKVQEDFDVVNVLDSLYQALAANGLTPDFATLKKLVDVVAKSPEQPVAPSPKLQGPEQPVLPSLKLQGPEQPTAPGSKLRSYGK